MNEWRSRISSDPAILCGKAAIKGSRISAEYIIELLASGWSETDIIEEYPHLTREDILACLSYAREVLGFFKEYSLEQPV